MNGARMSDEDEPRDEIELVSDGDGLAVIGDPLAVERFLSTSGVASRELNLAVLPTVVVSSVA